MGAHHSSPAWAQKEKEAKGAEGSMKYCRSYAVCKTCIGDAGTGGAWAYHDSMRAKCRKCDTRWPAEDLARAKWLQGARWKDDEKNGKGQGPSWNGEEWPRLKKAQRAWDEEEPAAENVGAAFRLLARCEVKVNGKPLDLQQLEGFKEEELVVEKKVNAEDLEDLPLDEKEKKLKKALNAANQRSIKERAKLATSHAEEKRLGKKLEEQRKSRRSLLKVARRLPRRTQNTQRPLVRRCGRVRRSTRKSPRLQARRRPRLMVMARSRPRWRSTSRTRRQRRWSASGEDCRRSSTPWLEQEGKG